MYSAAASPNRTARGRVVRVTTMLAVVVVAAVLTPVSSGAQLGWMKKLIGKGKKPAAAQAAQPAAAIGGAAPAGGAEAAPVGSQSAPSAQHQAEKDTMLAYGRRLDTQQPQTLASTKERLDFWEGLKLSGMVDPEVFQRYQQALRDNDALRVQDSVRKNSDASATKLNSQIERTTRALQTRNLDAAQSSVDEILAANPDNQRALLLRDQIADLQRAKRFKLILVACGAALLALGIGAAAFARKVLKRKESEGAPAAAGSGSTRKALIKIVDGVGRGKLFTLEGDVIRIGAAASDKPEEKNTIIISDSAAAVSRFHCSIIARGHDYFLIDSSLNGTEVNHTTLQRGGHHRLKDGDEFTLANVSRLKFMRI